VVVMILYSYGETNRDTLNPKNETVYDIKFRTKLAL
jgi:hypothetical protein